MNSSDYPGTFDGVAQILQRLRGPDGCPWDREQTRDSLKSQFLEEAYELIEAIEQGDTEKIIEEIGDVILHVVYQVQIGEEAGEFNRERVFQTLVEKLLRRHPHVFGDASVADADDAVVKWQAIKQQERANTGASILDGAPKQMPALSYAQAIQERAARVGFDWEDIQGALDKITEELGSGGHAGRCGRSGLVASQAAGSSAGMAIGSPAVGAGGGGQPGGELVDLQADQASAAPCADRAPGGAAVVGVGAVADWEASAANGSGVVPAPV